MKIILTAFNGKLRSDPIDWPDEMRSRDIHLVMDMERSPVFQPDTGFENATDSMSVVRARFEATNRFGLLENNESFEIYKLVHVDGLYFAPDKKEVKRLEKLKAATEKYDKTLVTQNEVLAELNAIVNSSYADELGTYDYDRIAEGVLELVEKYKEGDEDD